MFKALFNIILNMLASLIQIVVWPINLVVVNTMPDLTDKIAYINATLNTVFDSITWALGLIPEPVKNVLIFIVLCEIAKHTIYITTHVVYKVYAVIQRIKFW